MWAWQRDLQVSHEHLPFGSHEAIMSHLSPTSRPPSRPEAAVNPGNSGGPVLNEVEQSEVK